MELSQILDSLSTPHASTRGQEKTASYQGGYSSQVSSHNKLEQALNAALETEKTASARATPGGDLVKIAQKLADAEQLALLKEAELYGAAVCDGFISRMNDHEMSGNTKVASFGGNAAEEAMIKQAMDLGYRETTAQLEKVAQQAFAQGYNETVKLAQAQMAAGYQDTVKVAHQRRAMIKTAAENAATRGYAHATRILGSLAI